MRIREDLHVISNHIPESSRVLDLGCGDGELLTWLISVHGCTGVGVERDDHAVLAAIGRGVPLIELDIDSGLETFADDSYDVVVLSRTLQAVLRPDLVLEQMRRIAPRIIVTMPNFGYWRHRVRLLAGHMPMSKEMPYSWYETPNLKHSTLVDLEPLFAEKKLRIVRRIPLAKSGRPGPSPVAANLLASAAVYILDRDETRSR